MNSPSSSQPSVELSFVRAGDFLMLTKPELTLLSVLTTLAGFYLGSVGTVDAGRLLLTLVGSACVGGSAGALNQYIERDYDALMKRTERRPIPAGRITPTEARQFGISLGLVGLFLLAWTGPFPFILALGTVLSYLFVYTPLKRVTPHATLIGAIPGALPPVMGWAAAGNHVNAGAGFLFILLFLWQIPHFLSLAWLYRRDYARAGYRLMTVLDPDGRRTARHVLGYTIALAGFALLPYALGELGRLYCISAAILGTGFIVASVLFVGTRTNIAARRVFATSLAYLPMLMMCMALDRYLAS